MPPLNTRSDKPSVPGMTAPRVGHVYLDATTRQVRALNDAARELHHEGVAFIPADLKHQAWQRTDGLPVEGSDLPLLRAWREGTAQEAVFLRLRDQERTEQIRWTASPVLDEQGNLLGVVGTVLLEANPVDWLNLAGLAHDLRTPLQTLRLSSALLEATLATGGNVAPLVPRIEAATDRALAIARDLVEWCRAPAKQRKRAQTTFALEPFLQRLLEEHSMAAQKKNLTLVGEYEPVRGWEVSIDRVGLGRLLSNLVSNAIRYTVSGRIELTARWRETDGTRDADDTPSGDGTRLRRTSLMISVIDTGVGIASEEQESIFQPYERGRAARQEPESGSSGLGLAVVDRLVEDLGLTMEVYSVLGQGSTFDVVIPMRLLHRSSEG